VPFTDKNLVCADCGKTFIFSAEDQAFHKEKGFTTEPRRCHSCRASRRAERNGYTNPGGYGVQRAMYRATCSRCGKEAELPFQPRGDKPVYCSDCFRSQRGNSRGGYGERNFSRSRF
jgi:CxxC-x17-CxxC domain-containing protein